MAFRRTKDALKLLTMKKNDWILSIGIAMYSFLFFRELPGVNFLIFNLTVIIMLWLKNPDVSQKRAWWIAALGCIATGIALTLQSSILAFWGSIASLAVLSAISSDYRNSVLVGGFHGAMSVACSFIFMILDAIQRVAGVQQKEDGPNSGSVIPPVVPGEDPSKGRWLLIVIPVVSGLFFFSLYRSANPLFAEVTKGWLRFLSADLMLFTLSGLLILYGLFYHRNIPHWYRFDTGSGNNIDAGAKETWFDRTMSKMNEHRSGVILFALLNLLLFTVNAIDTQYLYIQQALPSNIHHPHSVHQGVEGLIFSIVVAIGLILYYFRGRLNFTTFGSGLRWLVYIWIVQNAYMVISTTYRNHLYIDAHSLTEKRLGVYIWLGLTLIGLFFTGIKILQKKSNWFLVRSMGWSFYGVLVISCFFNWTLVITGFNMAQADKKQQDPDMSYLLQLSSSNLPVIIEWLNAHPGKAYDIREGYRQETIKEAVTRRANRMTDRWESLSWKSWNLDNARTIDALKKLNPEGKVPLSVNNNHDRHHSLDGI